MRVQWRRACTCLAARRWWTPPQTAPPALAPRRSWALCQSQWHFSRTPLRSRHGSTAPPPHPVTGISCARARVPPAMRCWSVGPGSSHSRRVPHPYPPQPRCRPANGPTWLARSMVRRCTCSWTAWTCPLRRLRVRSRMTPTAWCWAAAIRSATRSGAARSTTYGSGTRRYLPERSPPTACMSWGPHPACLPTGG